MQELGELPESLGPGFKQELSELPESGMILSTSNVGPGFSWQLGELPESGMTSADFPCLIGFRRSSALEGIASSLVRGGPLLSSLLLLGKGG